MLIENICPVYDNSCFFFGLIMLIPRVSVFVVDDLFAFKFSFVSVGLLVGS